MNLRVFISYSWDNDAERFAIAELLNSLEGVEVLVDRDAVRVTEKIHPRISELIHQCDIFIALLTPAGLASWEVREELVRAHERGKIILPIIMPADSLREELPWFLVDAGAIEYHPRNFEAVRSAIVKAVEKLARPQLDHVKYWNSRDDVFPNIRSRFAAAETSVSLMGIALDTTIQNYFGEILNAVVRSKSLRCRLLMLHPDSEHVPAHQKFANWDVRQAILNTISGPITDLFRRVPAQRQQQIDLRLTHYLPRFAYREIDNSILVNFYLYGSRAQANPVIEFDEHRHYSAFSSLADTFSDLFEHPDNERVENLSS